MISPRSGTAKPVDAVDESFTQTKGPNPINKRASALAILRSGEEPSAAVLEKLGLRSYEDLLQSVANELKLPRLEIDSIDLDPGSFGPDRCAQTLLAKAQIIIELRDDDPAFHIYVRSSFAGYVADWLLDVVTDRLR